MEELIGVLERIQLNLHGISDTLNDISDKLDNISGAYSLDYIASKIDEATRDIVGETSYNLTDIHKELLDIESAVLSGN